MTATSRASTITVFDVVQMAAYSKMPMPMAAATVRGRLSILPMTAAARVRSSSAFPPEETIWNDEKPCIGVRRITATADNSAASDHTMVLRRGTGMPSSPARSLFSAAARMPTP